MGATCDFRPFPGNGAYGHWTCGRQRFHLGRHRFRNYTIGRVPRVWRLRDLWRVYRLDQQLRRRIPDKPGYGYRTRLFPTRYDPERT